jgi:hypothetical protein
LARELSPLGIWACTNVCSVRDGPYGICMPGPTRGTAGEAAVLNALVRRGLDVCIPFGEGQPYDLVIDLSGVAFVRVQCKMAWQRPGCLVFNARTTDHGRGRLSYLGRADVFGVYFPPNDSVYLVPVGAMNTEGRLRLEPTRNNQQRGVRFATDFLVDRWTPQALADLVATQPLLGPTHQAERPALRAVKP